MTAELLGKLVPVSIQYPKSDPTIKFQCKVTKKKNSELFIYVVGKVEMPFFFLCAMFQARCGLWE